MVINDIYKRERERFICGIEFIKKICKELHSHQFIVDKSKVMVHKEDLKRNIVVSIDTVDKS